jgi:hypothetical protein
MYFSYLKLLAWAEERDPATSPSERGGLSHSQVKQIFVQSPNLYTFKGAQESIPNLVGCYENPFDGPGRQSPFCRPLKEPRNQFPAWWGRCNNLI